MGMGVCDVKGCKREAYMGWRPLSVRVGRQICEFHWDRHCSAKDEFSLFDAFGFGRPTNSQAFTDKSKIIRLCVCGTELKPRHTYCAECAKERERDRKREIRRMKAEKQQHDVEQISADRADMKCKDCGEERLPGHSYCQKCAKRRKQQSNRLRQRKYRKSKSSETNQE